VTTSLSLLPLIQQADTASFVAHVQALGAHYPQVGAAAAPWGDGALLYGGPGSPLNRAVGLIDDGAPLGALVDAAEVFFGARSAACAIDCYPEVTPRLAGLLRGRGYRSHDPVRTLVAALPVSLGPNTGRVTAADTDDYDLWVATVTAGFREGPRPLGSDDQRTMLARAAVRPDVRLFLAHLDGEPIGGAALGRTHPVGFLFSGSVLPPYRGLGAQRALIHARLVAAMGEGLQFAVSGAAPGSVSERNLRRSGLDPLFLRETWVNVLAISALQWWA